MSDSSSPSTSRLVRLGLLVSTLFYAGLAWFMRTQSNTQPELADDTTALLRWGLVALLTLIVGGVVLLRRQRAKVDGAFLQQQLSIATWGLGNAAALTGLTFYLLTGEIVPATAALLLFLGTLWLVPVPPSEGGA
jgi:high-affinity Fe2+/Pb2+ permease